MAAGRPTPAWIEQQLADLSPELRTIATRVIETAAALTFDGRHPIIGVEAADTITVDTMFQDAERLACAGGMLHALAERAYVATLEEWLRLDPAAARRWLVTDTKGNR